MLVALADGHGLQINYACLVIINHHLQGQHVVDIVSDISIENKAHRFIRLGAAARHDSRGNQGHR